MDAYDVLQIPRDASLDEAEDAYRRLLLVHHPDLHQGDRPDQLAAAERMTSALNAAITTIRAGATRSTAGRPWGPWWASNVPVRQPAGDESRVAPVDPVPSITTCPMCGAPFDHASGLRSHAADVHDIHLDGGRARRRRRFRRRRLRVAHHSPWAILPVNALAALLVAAAAGQLTHDVMFARWTFAVAMAPTIVLALARIT